METSQNYEARVRCSVQQFNPVDEAKEVEDMITIIENLCIWVVCWYWLIILSVMLLWSMRFPHC